MRLISYSDNAEDVLLMRAFQGRSGGFFVDVGAADPVYGSVTRNLSTILGWRGVHIEPEEVFAEALARAYPGDSVVRVAAGAEPGELPFYQVGDICGLSTLDERTARAYEELGEPVRRLSTRVEKLDQILTNCAAPRNFDLLKIDVEKSEPAVLAGVDLERWQPRVILIEATEPNSPKLAEMPWAPQVEKAGYELALFDGLNNFYVRTDEPALRSRLSVQANVFDRYIPYHWYERIHAGRRPVIDYEP